MTALVQALRGLPHLPVDKAVLVLLLLLAAILVLDTPSFMGHVQKTVAALLHTAPYIVFAVLAVAGLKATGADTLVARAFEGNPARMILLAAAFGGLSPFCSCEVIPFVAGLLALGAPLPAVMAFWLSSPISDPASVLITAGALGWPFAIAKVAAAVGLGLLGGFGLQLAMGSGLFAEPLRERKTSGCCGAKKHFAGKPHWAFWQEPERRALFQSQAVENALFLLKWMTLAYLLESLMLAYVPAEAIAGMVGGDGVMPVILGALAGIPAYLNGYAAPALISGLVEQGMSAGAGLAFLVAGGVTCVPAMAAVWALVRPAVFGAYLAFGFGGAVLAGLLFGLYA
ncbi:MAG: permease [Rhodospirillales bacterium]